MNIECKKCKKIFYISPSRVGKLFHCSRECYSEIRNVRLKEMGKKYLYKIGHPPHPNQIKALKEITGEKHFNWKGDKVGYRGLHYWLRRELGNPEKCVQCNKLKTTPKSIQWANIDGKYARNKEHYISLCASCHKMHDLNLAKKLTN